MAMYFLSDCAIAQNQSASHGTIEKTTIVKSIMRKRMMKNDSAVILIIVPFRRMQCSNVCFAFAKNFINKRISATVRVMVD